MKKSTHRLVSLLNNRKKTKSIITDCTTNNLVLARSLYSQGLLISYEKVGSTLQITSNKFFKTRKMLNVISKKNIKSSVSLSDITRLKDQISPALISTSRGIKTSYQAKKSKLGGFLLYKFN